MRSIDTYNEADEIIPVNFTLDRNGEASISIQEYTLLKRSSKEYVVGSGKNTCIFELVHTSTGFVDIGTGKSGAFARWTADPFEIKSVVADDKNHHYAEIETNGKIVRIPFEGLLPDKICASLFSKGIAVCKTDFAHEALSMHLQWILSKFEVQDARQILGWTYVNGKLTWSGSNKHPPLLQYHLEVSEEEYISKLNELISNSPELQFVMCSSAASTLLAYLSLTEKVPVSSFGISLVGTSSTGKTTALQLASSLYSFPDDEAVFSGFYGTQNALMHMLGRHHGVPISYDESTIKNDMSKSAFVYAFAEGRDKLRLNQDSTLKERNSWLCTCLFSSEEYLVDLSRNENLGLAARIITLDYLTYTKNSSHSERIKIFAGKNYGVIGKMLSDYLLAVKSADILTEFEATRSDLLNRLKKRKCCLTERLAMNYSMIITTSQLMNRLGVLTDTESIIKICCKLHEEVSASANPGKNLVIKIFDYICCEYKHLKGIKWTVNKDGIPKKVEIIETTFENIVLKCGMTEPKTAVKHLLDEGYIIRPEAGRIKAKISIDGVACHGYRFDIEKVNEAFGPIDDEVYSNVKKYRSADPFSNEILDILNDEEAVIHAGNYKITGNQTAVGGKAFLL